MKNAVQIRTVLTTIVLAISAHAGPEAAAGVVSMNQPAADTGWSSDLATLSLGQAVSAIAFEPTSATELSGLGATVTTDSATNEIKSNGWWRLRGTTTTIRFDHAITSVWFEFAHEKTASVDVSFLGSTGVPDTITLDSKLTPTGSVSYVAAEGESFDSVRLTWTRASGHAMSLGPVFVVQAAVSVPGPGVLGLFSAGVAFAARRRRAQF